MNTTLPSVVTVPFHGANLFVVDHAGQPYVPMRPIVEGMGLAWAAQTVKINSNKERWGVSIIEMPSNGGTQRAICMPLRKLPGWLMSIYPNKVRADLRERIVQYQHECDDALWQYWNAGHAENPRATAAPAAGALTADQQAAIKALVHERVEALPPAVRAGAAVRCWQALKRRFGCTYKAIPAAQFVAAVSLVARLPLPWDGAGHEALPAPAPSTRFDATDFSALHALCGHVHHLRAAWHALEPALQALSSPVAAELRDHVVPGVGLAMQFERRFATEFAAARSAHAKARPARAHDPETAAWLRQIDAVTPGKPDVSIIREAAAGRARGGRPSNVATVLAELLASARAGRLVGLAAFAAYRDTTYDLILSHDTAWDPLTALGGVDRLHRHMHQLVDSSGW